jgi:hypothetical protein
LYSKRRPLFRARRLSDDRTRDESRRIAAHNKSHEWCRDLPDPCMCSPSVPLLCREAQTPRKALMAAFRGESGARAHGTRLAHLP